MVSAAACGDDQPSTPTAPTTPTTPANRAPRVERSIADLELTRDTRETLNIEGHFVDPDGDTLTYTATSSNTHVAPVALSGTMLEITAQNVGTANVRVEAQDPAGLSRMLSFSVTVEQPAGPITRHAGTCEVGMELGPGGSCDVPGGERFQVLENGSGQYGCCFTVGNSININRFSARRILRNGQLEDRIRPVGVSSAAPVGILRLLRTRGGGGPASDQTSSLKRIPCAPSSA